ncbi:MAG: hypothetical protein IJW50_07800 [Clostridia bacterium]|nr:hypothetical protein [Clostridia bacterium]
MKKVLMVVIAAVLCCSLCSCLNMLKDFLETETETTTEEVEESTTPEETSDTLQKDPAPITYNGTFSCQTLIYEKNFLFSFVQNEQASISEILNRCKWSDRISTEGCEYILFMGDVELRYNQVKNRICDVTNERVAYFMTSDAKTLEEILINAKSRTLDEDFLSLSCKSTLGNCNLDLSDADVAMLLPIFNNLDNWEEEVFFEKMDIYNREYNYQLTLENRNFIYNSYTGELTDVDFYRVITLGEDSRKTTATILSRKALQQGIPAFDAYVPTRAYICNCDVPAYLSWEHGLMVFSSKDAEEYFLDILNNETWVQADGAASPVKCYNMRCVYEDLKYDFEQSIIYHVDSGMQITLTEEQNELLADSIIIKPCSNNVSTD